MKSIGEQARAFRESRGWNTKEMADAVGTSRQNIESLETSTDRKPRYIKELAEVMGTTVDILFSGRYVPPDDPASHVAGSSVTSLVGRARDSMDLTIPRYDTGGRMGQTGVVLKDQPGMISALRVSHEWLQKNVHNITSFRNLAIVTGFGDSMRPLYNPGDPLLVDTGVTTVEFDAIYFFRVGEEGFIKRLQRIPGNGMLAISENKSYRDWTVAGEMDFEVFGRVVKVWRGEDF